MSTNQLRIRDNATVRPIKISEDKLKKYNAELRQQAIDQGLIPTQSQGQGQTPPKTSPGTYL